METEHSPDGGWGWMVVFGAALINMVNQAMFSIFGLVFGEELKDMANGKAYGITIVMGVSVTITNFSGLAVAPLMQRFRVRTITMVGILCTGTGMIISSFANSIVLIIIGYGIFTGLGLGLLASTTFLAINDYFTRRASTAVGLAMAGTSIGQMMMPIVVGLLLENYKFKVTTFALGLINYTGLIGVLFFTPLSCCKRSEKDTNNPFKQKPCLFVENETKLVEKFGGNENNNDATKTIENKSNKDTASHSGKTLNPFDEIDENNSENVNESKTGLNRFDYAEEVHEGTSFISEKSALNPFDSDEEEERKKEAETNDVASSVINRKSNQSRPRTCLQKMIDSLDLTLLADPSFVHILIGLAMGYTSTITFSTFFPMFLQDEIKFDMMQTTYCMTALSCADIIGRMTVSEICRRLNLGNKSSFMFGAILLGFSRSCLVQLEVFSHVFVASIFVGYFRAATVINQNLVIKEYIAKEKLPSAIGLNMVAKGLFAITLGQSLGLLKDAFTYRICIHLLDLILYLVVTSWLLEKAIKGKLYRVLINFISNETRR